MNQITLSSKSRHTKFYQITILLLTFLLSACGGGSRDSDIHLTSIVIFVPEGYKSPGIDDTFQLDASGIYTNTSANETITEKAAWLTSDPDIATVTSKGEVTTLSAGEVTITASFQDVSHGIRLTVTPTPKVESFKIETVADGYFVTEEKTLPLISVTIFDIDLESTPATSDNSLYLWKSSDEKIATVDEDGVVTGVLFGKATITVTAKDNADVTKTVDITVNAKTVGIYTEIVDAETDVIFSDTQISYLDIGQQIVKMAVKRTLSNDQVEPVASGEVLWDYDDQKIIEILPGGNVNALGVGTVNLTATVGDFETTHQVIIEDPIVLFVTSDTDNLIKLNWHEKQAAQSYSLFWKSGDPLGDETEVSFTTDQTLEFNHRDIDPTIPYFYEVGFVRNDEPIKRSKTMKVWHHKGVWKSRNVIEPRLNAASAAVDETIYLFGGEIPSLIDSEKPDDSITSEVWAYNILKNKWTKVDELDIPLNHATACESGGIIYIVGGESKNRTTVPAIHQYDTNIGKWTHDVAKLPTALSHASCNIYDNFIYISGGYDGTKPVATSYRYDIDVWGEPEILAALSTARYRHASKILNDKLYVAGGKIKEGTSSFATNQVEVMDLSEEAISWSSIGPMDTPRSDFALLTWSGKLQAIGGINNENVLLDSISSFSDTENEWQEAIPMPFSNSAFNPALFNNKLFLWNGSQAALENSDGASKFMRYNITDKTWVHDRKIDSNRRDFTTVILKKKLYVIGGTSSSGATNDFRAYDTQTNSWEQPINSFVTARKQASAVADDSSGRIFVLGGVNGPDHLNDLQRYDLESNRWIDRASMRHARSGAAVALLDAKIYIFGGIKTEANKTYEVYDIESNKWRSLGDLPQTRREATAIALNNEIYLIGGNADGEITNQVDIYNPAANIWRTAGTLDIKRTQAGSAMLNGRLYVFGGLSEGKPLSSVETFTPFTNSWDKFGSKLPNASAVVRGGSVDNKIIVISQEVAANGRLDNNIYILE